MNDPKARAYAIERRYIMLSMPWVELMAEIRAERGALLATSDFQEWSGIEKAERLDIIDTRLKIAEDWISYYEKDRTNGVGLRVRRWLKTTKLLSNGDLEGVI